MKTLVKWFIWVFILGVIVVSLLFSWKQSQISSWQISGNEIIVHEGKFRPWPTGVTRLPLQPYYVFLDRMNLRQEFLRLVETRKTEIRDILGLEKTYIQYLTFKFNDSLTRLHEGLGAVKNAEIFLEELKRRMPDPMLVKPMQDSLRDRYADYYYLKLIEALAKKHYGDAVPSGGEKVWLKDKAFVKSVHDFLMKKVPQHKQKPAVKESPKKPADAPKTAPEPAAPKETESKS